MPFTSDQRQGSVAGPCCAADDSEGEEPAECAGELRLEHVSFRYPARPDVMVMKDFCLDVKAGVDSCKQCGRYFAVCFLVSMLVWDYDSFSSQQDSWRACPPAPPIECRSLSPEV